MNNSEKSRGSNNSQPESLPPPIFSETIEGQVDQKFTLNARFVTLAHNKNCEVILHSPKSVTLSQCVNCQIKIFTRDKSKITFELDGIRSNLIRFFDLDGKEESEQTRARQLLANLNLDGTNMVVAGDGLIPPPKRN